MWVDLITAALYGFAFVCSVLTVIEIFRMRRDDAAYREARAVIGRPMRSYKRDGVTYVYPEDQMRN